MEKNKIFSLMSNVTSHSSTNDAMPCRVIFLVKLLLDIGSNILINVRAQELGNFENHFE
jgi:hypothetical protein